MSISSIRKNRAFSLIELVIVVVIIGIIAAIAIPRMSRGASGANDGALASNLSALRRAIDLYEAEHGQFPTAADFTDQLTKFTKEDGTVTPDGTKTGGFIFGPYIREIPPQTVGPRKGENGVAAADAAGVGWIYDETTGSIAANTTTEEDDAGKLYSEY